MASTQRHLRQWKHNRDFIATIDPKFNDWIVTASFYTSLHAIDAMLVHDRAGNITRHEDRRRILLNQNVYEPLWNLFDPLYGLCRTIRYFARPQDWIRFDEIEEKVFRRYLYPIEEFTFKRMSVLVPI